MIMQRIQPLANDHPEDTASCKLSSRGSGLLQIIIQRTWPHANNHPATWKWSSRGFGLLQMIIQRIRPLANDHLEGLASYKWSSVTVTLVCAVKRTFFFVKRTDRFFNGIFSKSFKAAASSWVSRQVDVVIRRGLICLTCHTFCSEGKNEHSLNQYIPVAVDGKEKRIWP